MEGQEVGGGKDRGHCHVGSSWEACDPTGDGPCPAVVLEARPAPFCQ